ncbi:ornithine decarboxylase-like [Watersipora subatra]|uniref:ornithine decarboxylase-like n=1 Tax=Watersipora subatra TaxID=2589382 RepID=UPI00355BDE31
MTFNLLKKHNIQFVRHGLTMSEMIDKKIEEHIVEGSDDAFFVCDLGDVTQKYLNWNVVFPRIKPFYAVKCNDDPALLNVLALLGTGFDCASKNEIQAVLSMGVSSDRIIYANPCKQSNYIKFAEKVGVERMTFDNDHELIKIKACFPRARLVLRILPPATDKVQCVLGNKFGCATQNAQKLLETAKDLELDVVGVSFHVGSGCYDAKAFRRAVEDARLVFDMALALGFNMTLLDVGGGFPGTTSAKITVHEIAAEMNPALDELFPDSSGVEIIAEPGRYFTASAYTLTTHVIAKRTVQETSDNTSFMYYINDGVYGSFNCLLYDHAEVVPAIPVTCQRSAMVYSSSIWGPTCDGLDKIAEEIELPELNDGDWIYFNDMGAYTLAAGSSFNGMPRPRVYYIAKVHLSGDGISAEDQFELHMKSGHTVCQAIAPLGDVTGVQLCSGSN